MSVVDDLFLEIDGLWTPRASVPIQLHLIGSVALMLQHRCFHRATKDVDVLELFELDGSTRSRLETLAGRGTTIAKRRGLYIDVVGHGIPFLPHAPIWLPTRSKLISFDLRTLDVTDVFVSKLKRFNASDRLDLQAIVTNGFADHARILERFRSAVARFAHDARAPLLPGIVANLNQVERDLMNVDETEIALPS